MINPFRWFTRVVVALERIADNMAKINADKLVEALADFQGKFVEFSKDFSRFLLNIPTDDPATQNKIDTAEASIRNFAEQVAALDLQVDPSGETQPDQPPVDPNQP